MLLLHLHKNITVFVYKQIYRYFKIQHVNITEIETQTAFGHL